MRITYRYSSNKDYWDSRWGQIPADTPMENLNVYPLRYAEKTIQGNQSGQILEAGCGAGRILRYYHERGYKITGMDFIDTAVRKLKEVDSSLSVEVGDVASLKYPDESFDYFLAFGLYHNLEHNLELSVSETYRVLKFKFRSLSHKKSYKNMD
jgi:ubiquinone/menaquinone biosynthesis C-methylase UbiE